MHDESTEAGDGGAGWQARLALEFELAGARTRLAHRRHRGPLLVQKPLYPEGEGPCHAILVHPPGGVVGGDGLALDVALGEGAHALLTTPAAGKFYRRGAGGRARVAQILEVGGGALEWLPQENIFYPDAEVTLRTVARLSDAGRFFGWEVGCLGLPAAGRSLEGGELRLNFELWRAGRPLLLERLAVNAQSLAPRWGMYGRPAFGTVLAYPADATALELARKTLGDRRVDVAIACTLVDGVLVCRALGARADQVRQAFEEVWRTLRPALLGRAAVAPRIWAT